LKKTILIALGAVTLVAIAVLGQWWHGSQVAENAPPPPLDFSHWAVLLVSGDNRAHSGNPSAVFDNARHDLAKAFQKMGFRSDNMQQFAISEYGVPPSEIVSIAETFKDLTQKANAGCLVYFTSHGAPEGILVGPTLATPYMIQRTVNDACGDKPTVVVMSSCYSGQFVAPLAGPNRVVLTAARPDRTSFGCGELDHYTYFDDCFLRAIPHADDFASLGEQVQACVQAREQETGAKPPSEPQLSVGPGVMYSLRYK
jgi:Peptidase C13 family